MIYILLTLLGRRIVKTITKERKNKWKLSIFLDED